MKRTTLRTTTIDAPGYLQRGSRRTAEDTRDMHAGILRNLRGPGQAAVVAGSSTE